MFHLGGQVAFLVGGYTKNIVTLEFLLLNNHLTILRLLNTSNKLSLKKGKSKNLNITSIVSFLKKHCPDNEADYNLMDWTI